MSTKGYLRVNEEKLKEFSIDVLIKVNIPPKDAKVVVDTLIQADLRGISTHGVMRLPIYIQRIQKGLINSNPNIKIIKESENTALLDGDFSLGQISSFNAMEIAIRKAEFRNIGAVGVKNSNHFGAAAYYAMMALPKDMIGFSCSNTPPLMPAPGGAKAIIGNNPLALAVPSGKELPIVLDMACSIAAQGKIQLAIKKGEKIPEGWAANSNGTPTTDPAEALKGLMLPMGGPKGYGLAIMVDIFAGILTGGAFGGGVASLYKDLKKRQKSGHFFMAIRIDRFMEPSLFKKRVDHLIQEIKRSPLAPGVDQVFLPGEIEFKAAEKNKREGLILPISVVNELITMADNLELHGAAFT